MKKENLYIELLSFDSWNTYRFLKDDGELIFYGDKWESNDMEYLKDIVDNFDLTESIVKYLKMKKVDLRTYKKELIDNLGTNFDLPYREKIETLIYEWASGISDFKDLEKTFNIDIDDYLSMLNLKKGVVGYSSWSYYLAQESLDKEYIEDVYEGRNFFRVTIYNDKGEGVDSAWGIYIPNDNELKEILNNMIDTDKYEIYLVDNIESEYFEAYPKIKKVVHETYTFEEVF